MWFLRDVLGCSPSKEKGSDDAADDAVPSCVPTKKIVVIVNKRSGSQMGITLARKLAEAKCGVIYLDEYLKRRDALMSTLATMVRAHRGGDGLRFVAAGGDGTVSWVAELVAEASRRAGTKNVPPIAVLSLGTGNELARVTGWGGTFTGAESLATFARDVAGGRVVGVDSWLWEATPMRVGHDQLERGQALASPRGGGDLGRGGAGHRRGGFGENGVGFGSVVTLNSYLEDGVEEGDAAGARSGERHGGYGDCSNGDGGMRNSNSRPSLRAIAESPERPGRKGGRGKERVRYSHDIARAIAMESDDLPHLPDPLFAPPPMTPPGAKAMKTDKLKKNHRGHGRDANGGGGGGGGDGDRRGDFDSSGARGKRASSSSSSSRGDRSNAAAAADRGGSSERRSIQRVLSGGDFHGPAINGVGFGRKVRSRASIGNSIDFDAAGFGFEADSSDEDESRDDSASDADELRDDVVGAVTKTSVCFFSVGFDASIAMQFHQLRERTPACSDSVTKVVAGHAWLGITELLSRRKYIRPGVVTLRVDGVEVAVPSRARAIQCFNIHSSATGIDFFGCGQPSSADELRDYVEPNIGDGLVEVVATYGVGHLSAIRMGFAHSHRLAQGRVVELELREALPVQVDGEPWLQPPAIVRLSSQGKIPFVLGRGVTLNVPKATHKRRASVATDQVQGGDDESYGATT